MVKWSPTAGASCKCSTICWPTRSSFHQTTKKVEINALFAPEKVTVLSIVDEGKENWLS